MLISLLLIFSLLCSPAYATVSSVERAGGGGGAPTDATYITQTSNGSLSAEQALASLSTGIMRVETTTGAVTSLTDSSGIAANISDETGSGFLVFATSPVFSTSLALPQGAAPTVDGAGEIAVDTTDDQLQYFGASKRVIPYTYERCFTVQTPTATDDNVPFYSPVDAVTITGVYCRTQGGTSAGITISDGTNALEEVVCDSDGQADDGSIANATFTANERMEFDTGTVTGTVDWANVCVRLTVDSQ